jgi:hypothetical protein
MSLQSLEVVFTVRPEQREQVMIVLLGQAVRKLIRQRDTIVYGLLPEPRQLRRNIGYSFASNLYLICSYVVRGRIFICTNSSFTGMVGP